MVYCGKPSKGCEYCRKRKIKCDQKRPECTQCTRAKQTCPGYRDPMTLMFRNESESVVRKAHQKKQPKSQQRRTASQTRNSADAVPSQSIDEIQAPAASSTKLVVHGFPSLDDSLDIPRNLHTPVQDLATCFFFHNFVLNDSDGAKGHLDDLPQMTQTFGSSLSAAISSVGMACLSNITSSSDVMVAARQEYASAVRLTNAALQDPVQSKADGMLMTVMLLGMFETITCTAPQSMKAWTNHVKGAAALLRVRGLEQFQRRAGLNMFFQLRSQILISAIQREVYIPAAITQLSKAVKPIQSPDEACSGRMTDTIVDFANLRASIRDGSTIDSLEIVSSLLTMDADLATWVSTLPQIFSYITKATTSSNPTPNSNTYEPHYHIYPNFWTATLWNNYRSVRILINELLLIHLNRISSTPFIYNPLPNHSLHHAQAHTVLRQLCSDVCASAPYHLGNVNIPWCQATSPPKSLGGFQVMWPLFVAGSMTWSSRPLQNWAIGQLESIGYTMGVQQAIPLAELMKRNGNLLEWSTGGNESDLECCISPERGFVDMDVDVDEGRDVLSLEAIWGQ